VNILFICHRIPYPPNKGDKIRSFHEIKYLSRKHKLYLAFLVDDERDLQYLEELDQYCAAYDYDVINPRRQKFRSLLSLVTGKPLSIPYFYSEKLQGAINRRLKGAGIDAIVCFSSPMAEYVFRNDEYRAGSLNGTKLIMDFVDVDSDKWRMYAGFSRFPFSAVYRREWRRLQAYEKKVGEAFDWSVFVSEKEVELFASFCPGTRAVAVANGVDPAYLAVEKPGAGNDLPAPHTDPVILFIGAMDYFPNEDAVLYFAREIWPLVRKELPEAGFHVVGGNPSKKVTALADKGSGIVVTGYVPDVRPYLAKADVFVAPIRIARGVQNKVLEAMAAGVPVVARPEAVQGISGHNGCIRVEENSQDFAAAVVDYFMEPDKREETVSTAQKFIAANYNWFDNLTQMDELLGTVPAGKYY
jgi:polysaccharide biosynthesis protein PslH